MIRISRSNFLFLYTRINWTKSPERAYAIKTKGEVGMSRLKGAVAIITLFQLAGCSSSSEDKDPYLEMNTLLVQNACSNCHGADYMRVGPSMVDIAAVRGPDTPEARKALAAKIMGGAQGSFGTAIMPVQKQVDPKEADELAKAILTMRDRKSPQL
jgi:cytochrome c551/c552